MCSRKRPDNKVFDVESQMDFILGATKTRLDVIDSEFNLLYIDPRWARVYGDPAGKKCYEYFMGRSDVCPNCGAKQALETKRPVIAEETMVKEGNRVVQVTSIPFRGDNGEWLVAEVNVDATERKELQKAREESDRVYQLLAENTADVVCIWDLDLNLVWASPSIERQTGYTVEEMKSIPVDKTMTPESIAGAMEAFNSGKQLHDEGEEFADFFEMEGEAYRKDGSTFWVENRYRLIRDTQDRPAAILLQSRDITERKKVEDALRESEERFRLIADNTSDGMWALGPDLRATYQSPATERILGYTLPEWATMGWSDFVHPDDLHIIMNLISGFRQASDTGSATATVRVRDKGGREKWAEIAASPIRGQDGRLDGIVGVTRDITDRKRTEQALRESEERFRRLFQTMTEGVVLIAPDGRIVEANSAAEHILGLTRQEMTERSYVSTAWKVVRPDGTPMPIEETPGPRAMQEKRPIRDMVMGIEQPGGAIVWLNVNASPLLNGSGGIDGVVGTFVDITERLNAFGALRESEEKYRTLVESIPQKVFLKDSDSVYISCNSLYAADLSIATEEISGRTDYDFYPRELADKYRADDKRVIESGTTQRIEERYLEHGEERLVETFKTPVKDESGRAVGLLGIFRDITEQKQLEIRQHDREIAETRAQEMSKSRRRLISTQELLRKDIASQLHGTVQNRLILLAHRLADLETRPASEWTADELADIRGKLEELQTEHIRPISHRLFPSVLRLGITVGLESLVDEYRGKLPVDLQISRRLRQSEQADRKLVADDAKLALYRIAEEALANILKHAPAAQDTVVKLSLSDAGILRLTVRDYGAGFDTASPSVGIGLAIASDYATAAGGTCIVKSAPGKGTRVTAQIPLAEPQATQRQRGRPSG